MKLGNYETLTLGHFIILSWKNKWSRPVEESSGPPKATMTARMATRRRSPRSKRLKAWTR